MYAPIYVPSRDDVAAGPDLHAENCCVKTCRVPSVRSGGKRVPQDQRRFVVLRVDLLNPRSKPTRSATHALPRPAARHAHGVKWRGGGAGSSRWSRRRWRRHLSAHAICHGVCVLSSLYKDSDA
jgi:hypothetical protein